MQGAQILTPSNGHHLSEIVGEHRFASSVLVALMAEMELHWPDWIIESNLHQEIPTLAR